MGGMSKKYLEYFRWSIRKRLKGKQAFFTVSPLKWNGKRVLLSYLTQPFVFRPWKSFPTNHQSRWECAEMARIFTELGYKVDVVDWDNEVFVPRKAYAFVIDIHDNLARFAKHLNDDCVRVIHLTMFHWLEQTLAEYRRLENLRDRRGVVLVPRRLPKPVPGIEYADYAVIKTNELAKASYAFSGLPIHSMNSSSLHAFPWYEREFERCRSRFVWLGGSGAVLKGLDLVLEAFSQMPDLQLSVCGPYYQEEDFVKAYRKELYETENISAMGWVDIAGERFREVLTSSAGLIFPSGSEGNPGSVGSGMHGGLIPIISRECGIDVSGMGILLPDCSVEEIMKAARQISSSDPQVLRSMSRQSWNYAKEHFSRERFTSEYRKFVREILKA